MRFSILAILLFLSAYAMAFGQEANHLARFYYSEMIAGEIGRTPLDPNGDYSDEELDAGSKGELEIIMWRRIGLGASRQVVARNFVNDTGQDLRENWNQYSLNLTLYARQSMHNAFNFFIGGGLGSVERYKFSVDSVRQPIEPTHTDLRLERYFGGLEYTFERIGFRLEVSRINASKKTDGQSAELSEQMFQHFSVYIPFN